MILGRCRSSSSLALRGSSAPRSLRIAPRPAARRSRYQTGTACSRASCYPIALRPPPIVLHTQPRKDAIAHRPNVLFPPVRIQRLRTCRGAPSARATSSNSFRSSSMSDRLESIASLFSARAHYASSGERIRQPAIDLSEDLNRTSSLCVEMRRERLIERRDSASRFAESALAT